MGTARERRENGRARQFYHYEKFPEVVFLRRHLRTEVSSHRVSNRNSTCFLFFSPLNFVVPTVEEEWGKLDASKGCYSQMQKRGGELIGEFSWPARGVVEIAFKD